MLNSSREGHRKSRVLTDKTAELPKDDAFGEPGLFFIWNTINNETEEKGAEGTTDS